MDFTVMYFLCHKILGALSCFEVFVADYYDTKNKENNNNKQQKNNKLLCIKDA